MTSDDFKRLFSEGPALPGPACPEEAVWLEAAAQLLPLEKEESLLHHAATCDCCAFRLREASHLINDPLSPEQELLAARLPSWRPAAADKPKIEWRRMFFLEKWLALAAACLVVVLGVWQTEPNLVAWWDERTVAQEFQHGRPSEFRLSGVPYGPAEVELGGSPTLPLKPAQTADPKDLRLAARRAFLEKDAARALALLEKARQRGDSSAGILNDLAVAHAVLGDQSKAEALLMEILRTQPNDAAALFNLTLLQELSHRRQAAIETAKKLQSAEPDSPWSLEIRRNLGASDGVR